MPTDRERQTLNFIRDYIAANGYAPKLREIGEHLGIRSRGTVHRYVRALETQGLIRITPEQARGIELRDRQPVASETGLPVLGRIAAGLPLEAIADPETIDLNDFFVRPGRFVLRVQGDSMIEDGIFDGDMVIVESCQSARDGQIVVALIDNEEATLKRLRNNGDGSLTLIPANAALQPFRYSAERVRIQGVVVGQFRSYR